MEVDEGKRSLEEEGRSQERCLLLCNAKRRVGTDSRTDKKPPKQLF